MNDQVFYPDCQQFLNKLHDEHGINYKVDYVIEGKTPGGNKIKLIKIELSGKESCKEFLIENELYSDGSDDSWGFWDIPEDDNIFDLEDAIINDLA